MLDHTLRDLRHEDGKALHGTRSVDGRSATPTVDTADHDGQPDGQL